VESTATGLLAGLNAVRVARGQATIAPPQTTSLGSLLTYITDERRSDFQPMNANYGLFPPLEGRFRGRDKKDANAARADAEFAAWAAQSGVELVEVPAGVDLVQASTGIVADAGVSSPEGDANATSSAASSPA
jgi:hypothetical protein